MVEEFMVEMSEVDESGIKLGLKGPGSKCPPIRKKYGLVNIWDFSFGDPIDNEAKNISSVWDAFVEASYLNGRDIEISIFSQILTVGNNDLFSHDGKLFSVELKEYHTFFAGTCYQIKSNFSMPPPSYVDIDVTFANSLDEVDQPKVRGTNFFLKKLIPPSSRFPFLSPIA